MSTVDPISVRRNCLAHFIRVTVNNMDVHKKMELVFGEFFATNVHFVSILQVTASYLMTNKIIGTLD